MSSTNPGLRSHDTEQEIATLQERERHITFVLQLSDTLQPLAEPQAIKDTATRLLGQHLQASRVAYFDVTETHVEIKAQYNDGISALPDCYSITALGQDLYAAYDRGQTVWQGDTHAPDG